jgi:hypothetical protein
VQSSDDVTNPGPVDFSGLGRRLYFSFLRLHKLQITTYRKLRKLDAGGLFDNLASRAI